MIGAFRYRRGLGAFVPACVPEDDLTRRTLRDTLVAALDLAARTITISANLSEVSRTLFEALIALGNTALRDAKTARNAAP